MARRRGQNEGSITQLKDGRWQGRVTTGYKDGKVQRKAVYGKTRQEAAVEVTKILANMQKGIQPGNDRTTVKQFLADWLLGKEPTVRPTTYRSYKDTASLHITPYIGHIVLTRLTPTDVQKMMRALTSGGAKAPTVRYAVRVLRIALNDAARMELIGRNAAALVKTPKTEKHRVTPLTPEQATKLLEKATDDRMEGIYVLAVALGLRQGELLGLAWDDVDMEAGAVMVRAQLQRRDGALQRVPLKTEESRRTLALPAVALAALRRQRTRQKEARLLAGSRWQETGYVFTSTIGTPIDARNLIREYHDALQRAELPSARFHDLRHSAASILLAMGASLHEVKEALGHSRIATTSDVYAHLLDSVRQETAARMDRAFGTG
jgi:integrase